MWPSKRLTTLPMRLWRRFNLWRALRIYARCNRQSERLRLRLAKADRLVRDNSLAPCPLFDRLDSAP
jgi:hypothetical protein